MSRKKHRIYRSRDPVRIISTVLISVVLAAVIICAGVFFGFRKYIVYTADGLYLDVPWLSETAEGGGTE